jgi:hypothetical protein
MDAPFLSILMPALNEERTISRIYEVPLRYTARSRAEGKKLTATDGLRAIRTLARYRGWRPPHRR